MGESREQRIVSRCKRAGCSDAISKIHFRQYMQGWNPHPPESFIKFWSTHEHRDSITVVTAYNSAKYRNEYMEAKSLGIEQANPGSGLNYAKFDSHLAQDPERRSADKMLDIEDPRLKAMKATI